MIREVNTLGENGIEDIRKFLESHGIQILNSDSFRDINFEIYGTPYTITWFINQSTLKIGLGNRPAQIPFRFIYFDNTFPLVGGNKSLGFSYSKEEKKNMFDREYPYEVFRIPLEI